LTFRIGRKIEFTNWSFGTSRYLQNCPRHHLLPCRNAVASPSRRRQHHASPRRTISSPLNHPTKPSSFSPLRFASSRAEPLLPLPRLVAAVAMAAELSSPRTSASAPFLPNPRAPQASPPSIDASRPLHRRPNPPERPRRGTVPLLSAGACGAAASDLLPANQGHPEVRLSPLSLFPNFAPTAGASPRRKPGQNSSSVLQCPPGTSGWNSKKPRGLSANPKTQWNSAIGTCLL